MLRISVSRIVLHALAAAIVLVSPCGAGHCRPAKHSEERAALRFEVRLSNATAPVTGRLFVVMSTRTGVEPRLLIGKTGLDQPPVIAHDVTDLEPGRSVSLGRAAIIVPISSLDRLPPGDYRVQAVLATNRDRRSLSAEGNLYSRVTAVHLDPKKAARVRLALTERIPPETLPPDTDFVRYVKLRSQLLSSFWGRPMFLRVGIVLPRDFATEPNRKYPLWVRIGGFGSPYTSAGSLMRQGSAFRTMWLADDTPRFIAITLDGDGPYGDPYQVNSANNGPYGDAVIQELIPYVEQAFRGMASPAARFLSGASTGGWVSLALQVFYPAFFNGCWSASPDPVDFRAYELINIYADKNAYTNSFGFERPSDRTILGDTVFTMRHECQVENVLGAGDSYTRSGGQWCAWNATFGRKGSDGGPVPLWDPHTGVMDTAEAANWKPYDLRAYLEANWTRLAPDLRGKMHITVGEADNYFLNNAVHLLDAFLSHADPPYEGSIKYGAGKGHTWSDLNDRQTLQQMQDSLDRASGHSRRD